MSAPGWVYSPLFLPYLNRLVPISFLSMIKRRCRRHYWCRAPFQTPVLLEQIVSSNPNPNAVRFTRWQRTKSIWTRKPQWTLLSDVLCGPFISRFQAVQAALAGMFKVIVHCVLNEFLEKLAAPLIFYFFLLWESLSFCEDYLEFEPWIREERERETKGVGHISFVG